jgi:hypothetical protein
MPYRGKRNMSGQRMVSSFNLSAIKPTLERTITEKMSGMCAGD